MIKLARVFLAALPIFPACALADDTSAQPTVQIRALTRQFDKVANRGSSSPAGLGEARERYGNYLRDAAASESKSQELREHAELFVLSGGDASVLRPWGEDLEPNSKEKKLLDGIMAYGKGRTEEAEFDPAFVGCRQLRRHARRAFKPYASFAGIPGKPRACL